MLNYKMIPKIIHQLWIGDKPMPKACMDTVKLDNPDIEYKLWTEKELSTLKIDKRYEMKIKCMKEINGKADMYRYLILKKYGGLFLDADTISLFPLEEFMFSKPCLAWENETIRQGLLACGFMGFPPNHPFIELCIQHILGNKIESPAWISVGNGLITKVMKDYPNIREFNVFPSHYFYPQHHTGEKYLGHEKVYMYQLWGSTHNKYEKLDKLQVPSFLEQPKQSITIDIPDDTSKNKLKEIMKSIKQMKGHFSCEIKYKGDLSDYLKDTRFIKQIKI